MKLDLNEVREESDVPEEELVKKCQQSAMQILEALTSLKKPDAQQTRIPARRDVVALCASAPYKKAVEDQNKPAVMEYPDKNPVIKSLIALEEGQAPITHFDLEIEIAVGHLLDRATTSPVYLTAGQIAREYLGLVNNKATVSDDLTEEVARSMGKLHKVMAYMEWENQIQQFKRKPKNTTTRYKGNLLEFREIVITAGGNTVKGYQFTKDFLPMHFLHGKATNQLIYPPAYCLDTTQANAANLYGLPPKKSTVRFKLIQRYLYREIVRMVKTKTGGRGLLYETIYKNIGEPAPAKDAQKKIDRDIAYCLELWTRQGIIGGYTAKARGKGVNKITILPPNRPQTLKE